MNQISPHNFAIDRGREKIRIGGDKADFKPVVRLGHRLFGDLEVSYPALMSTRWTPKLTGDKVEAGDNTYGVRLYPKDDAGDEGGFEWELILKRKVSQSSFAFKIAGHEQYNFSYQPPLTSKYANGFSQEFHRDIVVTETQVKDFITGEVLEERPEDIVDSWAVYHKAKRNHQIGGDNFKCGKAFHLKRVKFIDANGDWKWGGSSFNPATGDFAAIGDPEWLSKAAYPVIVDPTFGYATIGGSSLFLPSTTNKIASMASQLTANTGDTITKYSYYGKLNGGGSNPVLMTAYTVVGGQPSALLAAGTSIPTNGENLQWHHSVAVSQALTNGTTYCVALGFGSLVGSSAYVYYDDGSPPGRIGSTSVAFTDPFAASGADSGRHYTFYATYAAAPAAPTVTTQACSDVLTTSATGNGNITSIGSENATRRGFAVLQGSSGDPTVADTVFYEDGSFGTGAFALPMSGLTDATAYRVRAYAVNPTGTSYGATVDLTTGEATGWAHQFSGAVPAEISGLAAANVASVSGQIV